MTVRAKDICEVYPWFRKARGAKRSAKAVLVGYRFRFFLAGNEEPMLVSNGVYETVERAIEVAGKVNDQCFRGHYRIKKVRTV